MALTRISYFRVSKALRASWFLETSADVDQRSVTSPDAKYLRSGASISAKPLPSADRVEETAPCPSVLPFVVAFCASSLRCLEESDDAGKGTPVSLLHFGLRKGLGDSCLAACDV